MAELFPPRLEDQKACVDRELKQRAYVYPRRIAANRMTQRHADREVELMRAVRASLERLERCEQFLGLILERSAQPSIQALAQAALEP